MSLRAGSANQSRERKGFTGVRVTDISLGGLWERYKRPLRPCQGVDRKALLHFDQGRMRMDQARAEGRRRGAASDWRRTNVYSSVSCLGAGRIGPRRARISPASSSIAAFDMSRIGWWMVVSSG